MPGVWSRYMLLCSLHQLVRQMNELGVENALLEHSPVVLVVIQKLLSLRLVGPEQLVLVVLGFGRQQEKCVEGLLVGLLE